MNPADLATQVPMDLLAEDGGAPIWLAAREKYGKLASLLRVVDLAAGTDEVQPIKAQAEHGDLLLDGCCLIKPLPEPGRP